MAAKELGDLYMFPVDERPVKSGITFTTSWVEVDFSADVPAGSRALMLAVDCRHSDGRLIVSFTENNNIATPVEAYPGGILDQHAVYAGSGRAIHHLTVMTKSAGKFYIAEYDATTWDPSDSVNKITVLGYYATAPAVTALTSGSDFNTSAFTYGVVGDILAFNGEIVTNAAVSSGDTIGTLPAGSRPDAPCIIDLMTKEGGVIKKVPVSVDTNGLMVLLANVGQTIHLTAWNILRRVG